VTRTALPHLYSGKVRELYEVGHDRLLIVASDRISVFDVVLPDDIPDKGRVLTALSWFWFQESKGLGIVDNHAISCDPTDFPETAGDVGGRAMLVQATRPIRLECVVRGYLFGNAWSEYRERGTINGVPAPSGLREAEPLPEPWFTPTTKAEQGHDEALGPEDAVALVGRERYDELRDVAIELYRFGAEKAATRGVILADTKFEFGERDGTLMLIDECMTPDSSRYWPADKYQPGTSPPSFDKQFVRDYMSRIGWDKVPPAPRMPPEVIEQTRERYVDAYETITGLGFDDWCADT
jgi:phosphoribosylaminoimidazole-succinocarboxamide synthase